MGKWLRDVLFGGLLQKVLDPVYGWCVLVGLAAWGGISGSSVWLLESVHVTRLELVLIGVLSLLPGIYLLKAMSSTRYSEDVFEQLIWRWRLEGKERVVNLKPYCPNDYTELTRRSFLPHVHLLECSMCGLRTSPEAHLATNLPDKVKKAISQRLRMGEFKKAKRRIGQMMKLQRKGGKIVDPKAFHFVELGEAE